MSALRIAPDLHLAGCDIDLRTWDEFPEAVTA